MSSLDIEKTIRVIIYSYKGKKLQSVIENLQAMASGYNKIIYDIWDQYPLLRNQTIGTLKDVNYHHIFWDYIISPSKYIQKSITSSKEEYILILSDNLMLKEKWDSTFINIVNSTNAIVSGQGSPVISNANMFFLKVDYKNTNNTTISNWINKDLIFAKRSHLLLIQYPQYLKHLGIEEVLSATAFCYGLDVISLPSESFNKVSNDTIGVLYTPFSIKHNYNDAIQLIKTGMNRYINLTDLKRSIQDFLSFHSISSDTIKPLPFLEDDVQYDPHQTAFDKIDSRKFMTKIHYI